MSATEAMRLPGFLNLRRLEGRIVALFLALLLVVQLASFALISNTIARNADASISQELATGERVFRRVLSTDLQQHQSEAKLLEADHGFRQVLEEGLNSQELRDTLKDALSSHGERVQASLVAYADPELKLVTATSDQAPAFIALLPRLIEAQRAKSADSTAASLAVVGGKAYQLVTVPVRAAGLGGWVLMAFQLDQAQLQELQQQSRLQGLLLLHAPGQRWRALGSVLDDIDSAALSAQLPPQPEPGQFPLKLGAEHLRGIYLKLLDDGQQQLGVLLLRSFDEAVAPYRQLQLILLALTLLGVLVFALGSVLMARRISGPVKALAESAERLGAGDYDTPVQRTSTDEIGDLAQAFEGMRQGIRKREEQVHRLAFWDQLTDLPNREQFSQFLLNRIQHDDSPCAVLMLDLDRFKHVNDVLGHRFGDQLLCGVAERLQTLLRADRHFLARLGGDEFVLLLDGAGEEQALDAALRIHRNFEHPLQIEEQTVDLSAGIGIALYPRHGREVSVLLSRAELAMYAAKRSQAGSQVYTPSFDAGSQESLSLLGELRRAVENGELRLFLQPKVDLRNGAVISAEALVRWEHPQRGLVPPMQFIPFAEQTGFIRSLTAWVLEASADAWERAQARGQALRISVNLSTRDLLDQDLPLKIGAILKARAAPPQALCLEITESAIMDDPQRALMTLEHLNAMGFKLSIDDFGTGYSSLAYLKRLPVDELKIDKSFVMAMESDLDDAKIVRSTIELAHNLGLSVVAEGLETAKTWKLLAALGCDEGQGYYIAKPMPEAQFMQWLANWRPPELGDESPDTVMAGLG
ncbi:EAL domain-containing protein [Paucibacter sp. APW11]|uniref:EAL domain-containing protein n=1 Tax=Roseateles aquae TaxID=3077235 RepID=A0ABU3PA97_9BURK|nr:EAL domain-containing protein [Paucibacter sp. APW11]MDT8999448.1 EAL domain-containing protein [Paucibacter sp. APW11]